MGSNEQNKVAIRKKLALEENWFYSNDMRIRILRLYETDQRRRKRKNESDSVEINLEIKTYMNVRKHSAIRLCITVRPLRKTKP